MPTFYHKFNIQFEIFGRYINICTFIFIFDVVYDIVQLLTLFLLLFFIVKTMFLDKKNTYNIIFDQYLN